MKGLALALALLCLLLLAGPVTLSEAMEDGLVQAAPTGPGVVAATDPQGYRSTIAAALVELDRRGQGSAAPVAARLRGLEPVVLPHGGTVRPDISGILAALESQPPEVEGASVRLRALLSELDRSQAQPPANWGANPQERLQSILDRPEFRPAPLPDPITLFLQGLWNTAMDWLGRLLAPVLAWIGDLWKKIWGQTMGRVDLHPVGIVAGLLLIAGLIAWVFRGLHRAMGPAPVHAPQDGAGTGILMAEEVRAEALRLAQSGDFRGAVRALYLAALLHWDEMGRLRFDRSLTNREVLVRAGSGADPSLVGLLAPLVERFDRFWYGAAPCSAEDYADFSRLATAAWETI